MSVESKSQPVSSAPVIASSDLTMTVERDGFAIVESVINQARVESLRRAVAELPESDAVRRRTNVYGVRHLLDASQAVRDLAASDEIRSLVIPVLGPECFAVRATFFDKVPGANWNLRWHQDGVIAVRERIETPGFTAWSQKAGVWQVRPPEGVLAGMLAIRVHLDDCPRQNGALRVLAGSHQRLLDRGEIVADKSLFREYVCEVGCGGVVAMRPLALHASSSAESPVNRRVIHLEYAAADLPTPLAWVARIA